MILFKLTLTLKLAKVYLNLAFLELQTLYEYLNHYTRHFGLEGNTNSSIATPFGIGLFQKNAGATGRRGD